MQLKMNENIQNIQVYIIGAINMILSRILMQYPVQVAEEADCLQAEPSSPLLWDPDYKIKIFIL